MSILGKVFSFAFGIFFDPITEALYEDKNEKKIKEIGENVTYTNLESIKKMIDYEKKLNYSSNKTSMLNNTKQLLEKLNIEYNNFDEELSKCCEENNG